MSSLVFTALVQMLQKKKQQQMFIRNQQQQQNTRVSTTFIHTQGAKGDLKRI